MIRAAALLALAVSLAGCTTLKEVGKEPVLSPVGYGIDGAATGSVSPIDLKSPRTTSRHSLWTDKQSELFTDARALTPGDIMTVVISLNERASFSNESDRSRTSSRTFGADGNWSVNEIPGPSGTADLNLDHVSSSKGSGETTRSENIKLTVAAVVTDVLPNGNLVIRGSQEVRVNAELRILTVAGIVRPKDIRGSNTISYERIAEARISYGGRGRLTEVQQPPYGQQVLDIVSPF